MMRNWLIYRVYHEVIGQADGADYCPLVCDFSYPHVNQFMDAGWFSAATGGYFRPLRHV